MINKATCDVSYRCINKLNKFIKVHKDKKEFFDNNNVEYIVVYKILCNDCDVSYVGQRTRRKRNTRINEHINNKKVDSSRHSVITAFVLL